MQRDGQHARATGDLSQHRRAGRPSARGRTDAVDDALGPAVAGLRAGRPQGRSRGDKRKEREVTSLAALAQAGAPLPRTLRLILGEHEGRERQGGAGLVRVR